MGLFYNILNKLAEAALLMPFLMFPWRAATAETLAVEQQAQAVDTATRCIDNPDCAHQLLHSFLGLGEVLATEPFPLLKMALIVFGFFFVMPYSVHFVRQALAKRSESLAKKATV
jgi:hypothetical protein